VGYSSLAYNTSLIFVRLAVVAPKSAKSCKNSEKIPTYSSSRSSTSVPVERTYATTY